MPAETPVRSGSFELRGLFRPMADCGGDLWSWRLLDDYKVLLVIADATGHGAAPALLSAVAKGCVDAYSQLLGPALRPGELLSALNRAVYRVGRRRYMMSAFAVVLDTREGTMSFANAAQNFPFLLLGDKLEPLIARGNSLGAEERAHFETHERSLEPGSKLFLYTDGVTEAGGALQPFGERRLRQLLVERSGQGAIHLPGAVLEAVIEHLRGQPLDDDVTLVAFEYAPLGTEIEA